MLGCPDREIKKLGLGNRGAPSSLSQSGRFTSCGGRHQSMVGLAHLAVVRPWHLRSLAGLSLRSSRAYACIRDRVETSENHDRSRAVVEFLDKKLRLVQQCSGRESARSLPVDHRPDTGRDHLPVGCNTNKFYSEVSKSQGPFQVTKIEGYNIATTYA